jgi:hypothetical protein
MQRERGHLIDERFIERLSIFRRLTAIRIVELNGALMWFIRSKTKGIADLRLAPSLPQATTTACELLQSGADVHLIEPDDGLKVISADEIREMFAEQRANKGDSHEVVNRSVDGDD